MILILSRKKDKVLFQRSIPTLNLLIQNAKWNTTFPQIPIQFCKLECTKPMLHIHFQINMSKKFSKQEKRRKSKNKVELYSRLIALTNRK